VLAGSVLLVIWVFSKQMAVSNLNFMVSYAPLVLHFDGEAADYYFRFATCYTASGSGGSM
jgi:hypothetical protein